MKNLVLVFAMMISASVLFAGNPSKKTDLIKTTITGKVVDFKSQEALSGVTVQIEGSNEKLYTDFDGNFSLEVIGDENPTLYFSYISYDDQIMEVNLPNNTFEIGLKSK